MTTRRDKLARIAQALQFSIGGFFGWHNNDYFEAFEASYFRIISAVRSEVGSK